MNNDLISRQAAIDAIAQCTNCGNEDTLRAYVLKHSLDNGWCGGILEALDAVKDLPSAQPEPSDAVYRLYKRAYEAGQRNAQPKPIWGLHASVDRPLGDREIVPRLREIQKQIGGSYAIDRAVEVIEAIAERRTDE